MSVTYLKKINIIYIDNYYNFADIIMKFDSREKAGILTLNIIENMTPAHLIHLIIPLNIIYFF